MATRYALVSFSPKQHSNEIPNHAAIVPCQAVGVELMHVLRFICVNLIAVRKICCKHDRLLMNRMLGGYYHRTRGQAAIEDTKTLGGLIARNSGDIYEAQ